MTWHVLDANSIWVREFTSALARTVDAPVCAWMPEMLATGVLRSREKIENVSDPALVLRRFPLQRGYARFPVSAVVRLGPVMVSRLKRQTSDVEHSPLICTTPYYAPVAERWPGPVVYYQTDLTVKYEGADPHLVRSYDLRLCRAADLVCPNSARIRAYMLENGCAKDKIVIVPNATREANVPPAPAFGPVDLPSDVVDLPRPVAGVIGNLAANMDWVFLKELISRTPDFSWLLVGPHAMGVPEEDQRAAREFLLAKGGRVRFLGARPYGALQSYARSFDVAVLPYRKKEPTYSGSSTRFYEHLPACRPMLATRGFEELLHKEPLLTLSDSPEESAHFLSGLKQRDFHDGHERARWEASRVGTWEARAAAIADALALRRKQKPALRMPLVRILRPARSTS